MLTSARHQGDTRDSVITALFKGLADGSRLSVLRACLAEPRCVSEITQVTGLSQPNVSGHLACLWDCGLVEREQRGRRAYYSVPEPRVRALLAAADDLLVEVGERVYVCSRYHPEHQR
ncbi:MAG TPA: metalloregulator ArsR/SmtB family transcription factor [Dehalococcoidia bacterium]